MTQEEKFTQLETVLSALYKERSAELLFHGWHHISFVCAKAGVFAAEVGADVFLVRSAALVHDINYLVRKNSNPEEGKELRQKLLAEASYTPEEIDRIEGIVMEEHTETRDANISIEGQTLSDADTLFKALPITPIIFASKYIEENEIDIARLAEKICSEQNRLIESGIYFYTAKAKELYLDWAKVNLSLWNNVQDCLKDEDVKKMLETSRSLGALR